ncbi:hypothetical protein MYSEV_116 [Mythimna separata entomopoxvirus 'L']|uniref:Uncharacterized protein n=1 Tax=Mythimna separata entomopoxvirus 'L' TaxID=1293572 RepID=A0A916KQ70_9POXV|nr:hypothetical protein MYSEV_116 [Mythimna separata entomopoxvirus 'L']CCU56314.1 hypothetical protein MYSEV_116 [Mythimna separata entomopoxvirus 'L']
MFGAFSGEDIINLPSSPCSPDIFLIRTCLYLKLNFVISNFTILMLSILIYKLHLYFHNVL